MGKASRAREDFVKRCEDSKEEHPLECSACKGERKEQLKCYFCDSFLCFSCWLPHFSTCVCCHRYTLCRNLEGDRKKCPKCGKFLHAQGAYWLACGHGMLSCAAAEYKEKIAQEKRLKELEEEVEKYTPPVEGGPKYQEKRKRESEEEGSIKKAKIDPSGKTR